VYDYLLTSAIGVSVAGQGDLDALKVRVVALEEAGEGVQLSDDTPESLGTASAGVGTEASRADHVHQMPTAAQVGADISGAASSAITAHEAASDPHPQYTTVSEAGSLVQELRNDLPEMIADPATPLGSAMIDNFKSLHASIGMGGRGMIAITVDDGHPAQFTDLLPISKRMGFPMGVCWHNGVYDVPDMVAAAHDAGWEIQSHLPDNWDARSLTESQLRDAAISTRDAIAAITGDPNNIAFVYPMHHRNEETDRILSEYYTYGRGWANAVTNNPEGRVWLVGAYAFDTSHHDAAGNLSEKAREYLRQIAASNGQEVFYIHYIPGSTYQGVPVALENFVNYARSLGIQIVRPSDIRGNRRLLPRWIGAGAWTTNDKVALTSERQYANGLAIKITPPATGTWHDAVTNRGMVQVPQTPGRFGIYRVTLRYSADADIVTSNNPQYAGIMFRASLFARGVESTENLAVGDVYTPFLEGGVVPAANWRRISFIFALPPCIATINPALSFGHLAAGANPLYIDDVEINRLDATSSLSYDVTLGGAGGVVLDTKVLGLDVTRCGVAITPKAAIAGRVYYVPTSPQSAGIRIYSTDPADAGLVVRVTITPGPSFISYDLPGTVA